MVCKHCNSNNSNDAVFCYQCGRKLYGIYCPECDTHNEEGSIYCQNCGARLDRNRTCSKCGAELNKNAVYCTQCGQKIDAPDAPSDKNVADIRKTSAPSTKLAKAFRIAANALGIAIAALSIIFVLFMGCNGVVSAGTIRNNTSMNTFYYFGDAWTELSDLADNMTDYDTTIAVSYVQVIFGLLISVASIIAVLVLGIISIVGCAKAIKSNELKGGKAIAAFLVFVAGATGLLLINNAFADISIRSTNSYAQASSVTASCSFNGATVAGLALIGVLVAVYAVMSILSNGLKQINKAFIVNGSLALGSLIFAIIIAALATSPLVLMKDFTLSVRIDYFSLATISGDMNYNHFDWIFLIAQSNDELILNEGFSFSFIIAIALLVIAFVFVCVALIMVLLTIGSAIKDLTTGSASEMKGSLKKAIFATACSIIAFVLTAVAINLYANELIDLELTFPLISSMVPSKYVSTESSIIDTFNIKYGPIIAIMIMSIFLLGVEIARKIIKKIFVVKE